LKMNEPKRVSLYKSVASLIRAYANLANEMGDAGYAPDQVAAIKAELEHYNKVREEVRLASGDWLDMKQYEPAMRHLLDTYIRAEDSEVIADFEELGLIDLIVEKGVGALDGLPASIRGNEEVMAETIENNMRKLIIDEQPINPRYYERMSELLDALIKERREEAIDYKKYLKKVKELAGQVQPGSVSQQCEYPASLDTRAKQALYDNLDGNEALAHHIDAAVRYTKKDGWVGNRVKEREVENAVREALADHRFELKKVVDLIKNQHEYR